jgi:hypothetical protein
MPFWIRIWMSFTVALSPLPPVCACAAIGPSISAARVPHRAERRTSCVDLLSMADILRLAGSARLSFG